MAQRPSLAVEATEGVLRHAQTDHAGRILQFVRMCGKEQCGSREFSRVSDGWRAGRKSRDNRWKMAGCSR